VSTYFKFTYGPDKEFELKTLEELVLDGNLGGNN